MFVHLLTPRVGAPIELTRLNVLVGGNQSGKSTVLRDMFRLATGRDPGSESEQADAVEPVILEDMQYGGTHQDEELLRGQSSQFDTVSSTFEGLSGDLRGVARASIRNESWNIVKRPVLHAKSVLESELPDVMMLRTAYLDETVLDRGADSTTACSPLEPARNLLRMLRFASDDTRAELDAAFAAAFPPMGLRLDATEGVRLSLRVAEEFPESSGDPVADAQYWSQLPRIDEAGRGARNLSVVAMAVLLLPGRIMMVDEPDASLQPFAARQLGRWLASVAEERNCQLIVSARSSSLAAGMMERSGEVTLLRTRREGNVTRIGAVTPEVVREVLKSPMLSIDDALQAMTRNGAILAENLLEASAIGALNHQRGGADRWRVVSVVSLQHAAPLLKLMREAGLPAAVIGRVSSLQDRSMYANLLNAACRGETPNSWLATRDQLARRVAAVDQNTLSAHTAAMEEMLEKLQNGQSTEDAEESTAGADHSQPWAKIRTEGIAAIPIDQRPWVEQLLEELKSAGIFIMPHGALEDLRPETTERFMKAIRSGQTPDRLAVMLTEVVHYLRHPTVPTAAEDTARTG